MTENSPCKIYDTGQLLMKVNTEWLHLQIKQHTPVVIYARGRFRGAVIKGVGPRFAICQYSAPAKPDVVKTVCVNLDKLYEVVDPTTTTIAQFQRKEGGRICEQLGGRKHWFVRLQIG